MMEKSELVEIVLENCDVYGFRRDDLGIYLDGLGKHYFGSSEFDTVEHCAIVFHERPNKEIKVVTYDEAVDKDWWGRIKRNPDITQIHINGQAYYVKWADDEWNNKFQTNLDEREQKVVIISKTRKTLDDF